MRGLVYFPFKAWKMVWCQSAAEIVIWDGCRELSESMMPVAELLRVVIFWTVLLKWICPPSWRYFWTIFWVKR